MKKNGSFAWLIRWSCQISSFRRSSARAPGRGACSFPDPGPTTAWAGMDFLGA
jgi:hypothetical protein